MSPSSVSTGSQASAASPAVAVSVPSRPRRADSTRTRTPRRKASTRRALPGLVAGAILASASLGLTLGVVLHVIDAPGAGGWMLGSLVGITFGTGLLAAVTR